MGMPDKITAYNGRDTWWWTDLVPPDRPNGTVYIRLDLSDSYLGRLKCDYESTLAALKADNDEELLRLGTLVDYLERQTRCPVCGCSTPEEAEAKECGCDALVCAMDADETLAEAFCRVSEHHAAFVADMIADSVKVKPGHQTAIGKTYYDGMEEGMAIATRRLKAEHEKECYEIEHEWHDRLVETGKQNEIATARMKAQLNGLMESVCKPTQLATNMTITIDESECQRREREAFEAGMQEKANRLQFMNTIGRFDAVEQAFAAFQSRRKEDEK